MWLKRAAVNTYNSAFVSLQFTLRLSEIFDFTYKCFIVMVKYLDNIHTIVPVSGLCWNVLISELQ